MASHFSECNHTWRDKYLQRVCMGRIHARKPPASSSLFEPSEGFERPWHRFADSPLVVFYFTFFLSSRPCSRESFALYSNKSLNRQEAAPISMRCVYHLSPGILIYTAVKKLAPNIFYFEPQWRGCAKGLAVLVSLFYLRGVVWKKDTGKKPPPNLG